MTKDDRRCLLRSGLVRSLLVFNIKGAFNGRPLNGADINGGGAEENSKDNIKHMTIIRQNPSRRRAYHNTPVGQIQSK
jgi:hypothetical protein